MQKSIELAQFYKTNILDKYSAIKYVYTKTGLLDIIQKIKKDDMKDFSSHEMEHLLSESDIKKLKETQKSDSFINAILEANVIYNLKLTIIKKEVTEEEKKKYLIDTRPIFIGFFSGLLSEILNNMELFAMYFTHKAADDSVVFQSLHQTYLEIVQVLYYQIASMNNMKKGAYYTNLTELYHKWYGESKHLHDVQNKIKIKGTTVMDLDT